MILYVYIINIFIYSDTRLVLGLVPAWFGYFGYKNVGTVRVFEGIGPVPVLGISVRFRFSSSVPVILPRPTSNPSLDLGSVWFITKPQSTKFISHVQIFLYKSSNPISFFPVRV